MPIQAIGSNRLYRQIATQLSGLFASGEFAEAQRLPSERGLANLPTQATALGARAVRSA